MARRPKAPGSPARALVWSFANTAFSKIGGMAIGIVLARLLGPEQFGTFAVAMVALMAVLSFSELGVSLAIVRWRSDPREIVPTVTTISVLASLAFYAAGYFAAPAFSSMMGSPEATPVVRWLLVAVVVNGVVAAPAALLQREFRQGVRTAIDQVNTWLGAAVSIVLALLGWGAMSLAAGRIVGSVVSGVMFVVASPLPVRFGYNREVAGKLIRFGLPLAGASIAVFLIGYVDQIAAGAILGTVALGYYVLAFNLASWPVTMFSQPLRAVAPAAFARIQDDPAALSANFQVVFRAMAALAIPACLVIAGSAEPIIAIVYGEEWLPAAVALQWLAGFAAVRIMFELSYDFLVVVRKTGWVLTVQLIWILALGAGVWVGAQSGIAGIAAAQLVIGVVIVLPLYLWGVHRSGVALMGALARSLPSLLVGGAGLAAALIVSATVPDALAAFGVCFAIGLVTLAVAILLDRKAFREVLVAWRNPAPATTDQPKEALA
ncbi:MAG: oligosaccharide flippase family protein [Propioniciclava sp.]|uniref:oligosaccharide flippase family protein n=1 Tax=Propioniciclava sp. TaxID=2038686 RepID=UPI0039E3BE31